MKMVKILVSDYSVIKQTTNGPKEFPYNVKESIAGILFHPDLKLGMRELLKRKELSDRIELCKDDYVFVTQEEYTKIKGAFDTVTGYTKDDYNLLLRIEEAEEVEVTLQHTYNGLTPVEGFHHTLNSGYIHTTS